jgi:hypothetical protein
MTSPLFRTSSAPASAAYPGRRCMGTGDLKGLVLSMVRAARPLPKWLRGTSFVGPGPPVTAPRTGRTTYRKSRTYPGFRVHRRLAVDPHGIGIGGGIRGGAPRARPIGAGASRTSDLPGLQRVRLHPSAPAVDGLHVLSEIDDVSADGHTVGVRRLAPETARHTAVGVDGGREEHDAPRRLRRPWCDVVRFHSRMEISFLGVWAIAP